MSDGGLMEEDGEGLVDTSTSEGKNVTKTTTEIIPTGIFYTVSKPKLCFYY